MDSNGQINHVIQYVGTLPDISEHSNHDIGEVSIAVFMWIH